MPVLSVRQVFPGLALKRLDHSESLLNVHLRKFLEKEGRYDLKHRVKVLLGKVKKNNNMPNRYGNRG